jgi:hypothetical protein
VKHGCPRRLDVFMARFERDITRTSAKDLPRGIANSMARIFLQANYIRTDSCAAVLDSTIFVFGGATTDSKNFLADLEMFSPRTSRWTRSDARNEPAPRIWCAMAAGGGNVFVFGGFVVSGAFRVCMSMCISNCIVHCMP